jgi:anti-sigma B factor antagonist
MLAIDLADVPYIDSTGIGVLVGAAHRAKDLGRSLSVERPQRNVARVLSLLGVGADLNVTGAQQ